MVSEGPDEVRARVRDWLVERLGAAGAQATLADPADWSDWNEETRR
jgi:hypothetical protein